MTYGTALLAGLMLVAVGAQAAPPQSPDTTAKTLKAAMDAGKPLREEFPTGGKARWFEVTAPAPGVEVRSVDRKIVLGLLAPQARFLSFGSNEKWVTFGFQGQVAFAPVGSVSEVYPEPANPLKEWKPAGETLEKKAQKEKERLADLRKNNVPLAPSFTNTGTSNQPGGAAGAPGLSNMAFYGPGGPAGGGGKNF